MKFLASRCASAAPAPRRPLRAWAALAAGLLLPMAAGAAGSNIFDTTVVDQLFCGFLDFSKGRLAPFIAVAVIIIGVVGHWVGATKVWASVLYVAIGVGIIMGVGPAIARVTSSQVQCLATGGGGT